MIWMAQDMNGCLDNNCCKASILKKSWHVKHHYYIISADTDSWRRPLGHVCVYMFHESWCLLSSRGKPVGRDWDGGPCPPPQILSSAFPPPKKIIGVLSWAGDGDGRGGSVSSFAVPLASPGGPTCQTKSTEMGNICLSVFEQKLRLQRQLLSIFAIFYKNL